ncbi:OmpA family protein (plasmid) [Aliivibrio salmonicida]|uniref:OmpA family protein n=1 Tax=Aliivibrio salmonicida TaxID=40269 RepID=UPI000F716D7D|nr:OmpA family protein [Aliivibrio salmonicida]AZL83377.1 OmpA family protein [Aliivibrio salmonicida]
MRLRNIITLGFIVGLTGCSAAKEGCNVPIYVAPAINLDRTSAGAYTENLYERYAGVDLLYLYNKDHYSFVEQTLESSYISASEYGSIIKLNTAESASYRPYGLDPLGNNGLSGSSLDHEIVDNTKFKALSSIFLDQALGFEFDSYTLNSKVKSELDKHLYFMKKHKGIKVSLVGNADNIGPTEYNLILSKHRANVVRDYLVKNGLKEQRINSSWTGEQGNGAGKEFRNVEVDYE